MTYDDRAHPLSQPQAIVAQELTRAFGERVAVDHVSFEVMQGEVFGFLDPNGGRCQ